MSKRYFRINTGRYGGELAIGSVSKEVVDYWKEKVAEDGDVDADDDDDGGAPRRGGGPGGWDGLHRAALRPPGLQVQHPGGSTGTQQQ